MPIYKVGERELDIKDELVNDFLKTAEENGDTPVLVENTEQAGKTPPQVTGAPVEETAAPEDTVSMPEDTSLESQKTVEPLSFIQKGVVLTENQLKAVTNFEEDTDFGDSYILFGPNNYKQNLTKSQIQEAATKYGMTAKDYLQRFINNPNYGVQVVPGGETNVQTLSEVIVTAEMPDYMRPIYNETKYDLIDLEVQTRQKESEFLDQGYNAEDAKSKAEEFKLERTQEILQLKNRKLQSQTDRQILANLLQKPEEFSLEQIDNGVKLMSDAIIKEQEQKLDGYKSFSKEVNSKQVELRNLKAAINAEQNQTSKSILINQYNESLSDIKEKSDYWNGWVQNYENKLNEFNKALAVRNEAVATSVFNKTISDQALKDYSLTSRVDYNVTEFVTDVFLPFYSDKVVLENQKLLDIQKDKLVKAMSVDDASAEGLVLRSWAESAADNSASTIGSVLLYTTPAGAIAAPVVFGLSSTGQRRSQLLQQQAQGAASKAYLFDQLKSAKGQAAEDIKKQIAAIDGVMELTSSGVYLTSLASGVIEGGITYLSGQLGLKGINAIPGLRNVLSKSTFARNLLGKMQIPGKLSGLGKAARVVPSELIEETSIAGLDNELVDGLILGNRKELSEVFTKEFFRDVIVNTVGVSSTTAAAGIVPKVPLLMNNRKAKLENKKLVDFIINEKEKLKNFDTREELSEQDQEARNTILKNISETADKLNINQQNQLVSIENLTNEEIKTLYRAQAEKASIRTKVSELNAEAIKQGKKLEDLIDRESLNELQRRYDILENKVTEITNPLSEEKSKDLTIEQQYDLERAMYNLALARTKGDTFVLGENLAEELVLSQLQELSNNEQNLTADQVEARRVELKDALKAVLSKNSSFAELDAKKQKAVLDYIENNAGFEQEIATSNGQYIKGTGVKYVNMPLIEATVKSDSVSRIEKVSAIEAPVHETLHEYTDYNKISDAALINAGVELKKRLESKYKDLSKEDVDAINERIQSYENSNTKVQAYEELMNLYNDLNRVGIINDSEIDNSYNLFGLIKEVRSNVFAGLSKAGLSSEKGIDAISHLRGFDRYLNSKKQAKVDLNQQVDTDVTSTLSSKNLDDIKESFDTIVSNPDGTKKFNTKEEFKSSDAVNEIRTLIENTNILDGSIKNLATRYGAKSVDIKAVKEIISDRVANNFNPELNESLFGYILGRNGILNFAYRDYVNNQNKQVDAESIDVQQGEVGFVGQVADEYVDEYEDFESMDISIGARKKQVEEAQLIEPAYIFGEETGSAVDQKAVEFVENNDLEDVNMKSTPMFGIEEVSSMLGIRPNVIFDKKLNLNSGEVASIADFIYNNIEDIIRILPDAFVEEGVSQKYVGTSTGVPTNLLKLFYISTNDADASNRIGVNGLYPWILKGELQKLGKAGSKISEETKNEILAQFGILPDGKLRESGLGRRPEGQSMKGIMGLVLKLGSNTAIRKAALAKGEYDQIIIEDIGAGKSLAMASSNLSNAEIKADFTKFKKATKASTAEILDSLNTLTEEKNFNFTQEEINKAIEEGFIADGALGPQSFVAERMLKIRDSIRSLALGIDVSFFERGSKSLILGYFGLDHRTALLDFNSIQELSGKGEQGDLYKKSLYENGEKVKDPNRAKEIIAKKEDVYDSLSSTKKPSYKISTETKILFDKVKGTGSPYTSKTAKKYVGLNKEQAEQKAFEDDFNNNEERVDMLRALDSLVLDYYKHKIKSGNKQEILDAISLITFMTQSTSNIARGRRALATIDINASIFDQKAVSYQIEHLDTNVKTSMEFFNGILLKQDIYNITIPEIAVLPVYGDKVENRAGAEIVVNKKSVRAELDKIPQYKFGTKKFKKKIINDRKQEIYFPNMASKGANAKISPLESRFAGMIAAKDNRITAGQKLDLATAKNLAAQRKKRFDIIAPGANDFDGLMYTLLGEGKLGEEQYEWIKENLYKPYSIATYRLNNTRQDAAIRFKRLKKENKELFKKLQKDSGFGGFTFEQALRVWLFQKAGHTPSGLDEDTQKALVKIVKNNKDIEKLGKDLSNILPIEEYWVEPDANNWQVENLKKDVVDAIEKVARKQFLSEWKNNVDEIFSKNNMNKLLAAFGEDYVEALKDMLYRMETGNSRPEGSNARMNRFMNWVRGSVATTMFFNRRSAVLQQISNVNFLNWGDNNPIAAAKAFANFDQYTKDFLFILNSNYLKERRGGLKTDVNAADLADAIKRGGYSGFLAQLLQAGFSLTQYGDSFAIATGGATFYRNRINTYLKQGKSQQEAEQQAFLDFQEISEETQQSARPDRLSQEQTTVLGRVFLAFQNTPMQMTRLAVKAGKDLIARRGDPKQNIFKMGYYGVVQSIVFSMLQTALIGDMFDFDDDEDEKKQKLKKTKTRRVVNGVVDSFLKGTGIYGVFVTTAKNAALKFYDQQKRIEEGKRPDYTQVLLEGLNVSPPIGIKARNFYSALKNYEYNSKYIKDVGYNLNNPALDIGSSATEALLNIPAHNVLTTVRDLSAMVDEDVDTWNRIALGLGWHTWDLGLEDKQLDELKSHIKKVNKQLRQSKKIKRGSR